jgi:hypothetical protein
MNNLPPLSSVENTIKSDVIKSGNWLNAHPKFTLLLIGFIFGLILGLIL